MLQHSMLLTRIQIYNQSLSSLRTSSTHPIPLNKATSSFFKARKALGENFYMKTGLNWMQCVDVSMWGASSEFICKKNGANFSHEHVWILLILSIFKPKVHCTYTAGGHVSLQQNRSSTTFVHTTEPETLGMNLWVRGQEIRNPDPGKHLLIATKI